MSAWLLVVEDEPTLAATISRAMSGHFDRVVAVCTVAEAVEAFSVEGAAFEVIVADVHLPDGNGLGLVERLRCTDPSLGAVVATGLDTPATTARAVELGVQGFLLKPFGMSELLVNVLNARHWRALDQAGRLQHDELAAQVENRSLDLEASRWETIRRLSLAAEYRDPETGNHLERMSAYSAILARRAGLSLERCEEIRQASPMHDIGKIAIPDHVLTHDGPFTPEQRAIMNTHTLIGHRILAGSSSPLLETAARIAVSHHEWFDGSAHPYGLRGDEIPVEGRIVAIADVFDALTSQRRYKRAFTVAETVELMRSERGTHFDPELLDLFLASIGEALFVRDAYLDLDLDAPSMDGAHVTERIQVFSA